MFQVILASSEWEAAEHFCGLGLGLAISTIASSLEGKKSPSQASRLPKFNLSEKRLSIFVVLVW